MCPLRLPEKKPTLLPGQKEAMVAETGWLFAGPAMHTAGWLLCG